ncbi:MAG: hypothetical protein IKT41_05300 [Clostridia bacterium]|nr:hypothetical protein [Clostridia bacterium]
MMKKVTVLKVGYSNFHKCVTIRYEGENGYKPYAAVAEKLSVKVGDKVWILKNDRLIYKGFSAVAVLQA